MGYAIRKSPALVFLFISALAWVALGVPNLQFHFETNQTLSVGLFLCGIVIAMEEFFQTNTISGISIFPLVISLAMILNPTSDYCVLFIIGLLFPMVFLISKSKGGGIGRIALTVTLVTSFFSALFFSSEVASEKERMLFFALGATLLTFVPFVVRIYSIDQNESAWKALVLHQTILRMGVITLAPTASLVDEWPGLQKNLFWLTLVLMGALLLNSWVRRHQRTWDCSFQAILSLFVINIASTGIPTSLDWLAGATLTSLVMSLVPTQRPSKSHDLTSQILIATENGSLGGAIFLFCIGALVPLKSIGNAEEVVAQAIAVILVGISGWVFIPSLTDAAQKSDSRSTPKLVFQAICILGALAMAGYKFVDVVTRRIDV